MTKELAKTQETGMTISDKQGMHNETILRQDVIIPKLLLMQGQSQFVYDKKAEAGQFVRSTTAEILGNEKQPVDFIPITFNNEWRLEELVGKKMEYRGRETRTAKNEDLPWEYEQNGTKWKRTKVTNVFALLPQDLNAEATEMERATKEGDMFDLNKVLMPVVISFRSTGFNAGKAVVSHFAKAQSMAQYGAKAQGYTMQLKCSQQENDNGKFYVPEVYSGARVPKEWLAKALEWYSILSTQPVVIDESDEGVSSEGTGTRAAAPRF